MSCACPCASQQDGSMRVRNDAAMLYDKPNPIQGPMKVRRHFAGAIVCQAAARVSNAGRGKREGGAIVTVPLYEAYHGRAEFQ